MEQPGDTKLGDTKLDVSPHAQNLGFPIDHMVKVLGTVGRRQVRKSERWREDSGAPQIKRTFVGLFYNMAAA